MSEPGWAQLTRPVPVASDCSASKPSAMVPLAATAVPPLAACTVATVPGTVTATGRLPAFPAAAWLARPAACDGTAIVVIADDPEMAGGHDRVTEVTAAA